VKWQTQRAAILFRQRTRNKPQIALFVIAVQLVTDDRMTDMREMNADLMLAAGLWNDVDDRERGAIALE
jgi:hypothetical protein